MKTQKNTAVRRTTTTTTTPATKQAETKAKNGPVPLPEYTLQAGEFHGWPTLTFVWTETVRGVEKEVRFGFGTKKARMILENIATITEFVQNTTKAA